MRFFKKVGRLINKKTKNHRLTFALVLAIIVALTLTGVSVAIYVVGGFYRYDLSRPGYEKEREEVAEAEPQKTYDTTSPLSVAAIDEFLVEFDGRKKDLTDFGGFKDDESLSDVVLGISSGKKK